MPFGAILAFTWLTHHKQSYSVCLHLKGRNGGNENSSKKFSSLLLPLFTFLFLVGCLKLLSFPPLNGTVHHCCPYRLLKKAFASPLYRTAKEAVSFPIFLCG